MKTKKTTKKTVKKTAKKKVAKKKVAKTKVDKDGVVKVKKKPGRKRKKYYVNPEDFKNQILDYYKTNEMCKELGDAIYNIANRLGFAPNFINYTYKEEMIGDAIVKMLYALKNKKFNVEKGNAFPYFTTIAYNAFINRIKKEKKEHEFILNYQEEVYNTLMNDGHLPSDGKNAKSHEVFDSNYE